MGKSKARVAWLLCALWCVALPALAFKPQPAGVLPATGSVEVLFSPWQDVEERIIDIIDEAQRELFVQAFLFTSQPIAQALIEAHRRGVAVEVMADAGMNAASGRSQAARLAQAGVPVWLETRYASAHNKVILADPSSAEPVVLTGSYNFTFSARTRNAENVLVLRGHRDLAATYLDNWRRHRRDATAWQDRDTLPAPPVQR